MAEQAGRAYVDIKPDLSGFGSRLSAGLAAPLRNAERGLTRGLTGTMKTAGVLAAGALGVGALAASVKSIVSIGIEYDRTLSIFKSVTQASAAEMAKARATAITLGNALDLPGVSAAGAASAMTELAKAGLTTQQSIDAARGALQLSIAAQTSESQAATITANALLTFGLNAKEAGRVTDLLAGAANASSASMTDIAYALAMGGTAAKSAGVPIQDTITALTMLANAGIKGSDAGTLLKTALMRMTAPTKKASDTMKDLGLKFFDGKGQFVGMRSAVDQLQKKLGPLTTAQKAAALSTIFGADASRFASIAADQGSKSWDKYAKQVGRSGQAAALAKAQNTGLGGALDNLQSTAEGVGLRVYAVIQPAFTSMVKGITGVVGALPGLASSFGTALGAIYDLLVKGDFTGAFYRAFNVAEDSPIVGAMLWVRDQFIAIFGNIKAAIPPLVTTFNNLVSIVKTLLPIVVPVAAAIGGALLVGVRGLSTVLPPVAAALASVTGFLASNMDAVLAITGAIGTFVAVLLIQKAVTTGVTAVTTLYRNAIALAQASVMLLRYGIFLLNTAFAANPIGIIIALIAGLIVGIVILYKRNAAFRALVQQVWSAIKTAIGATVGWITGTAVPAIVGAWNWIVNGVKSLYTGVVTWLTNAWNSVKAWVTGVALSIAGFVTAAAALGLRILAVLSYPFRLLIAITVGVFMVIYNAVAPLVMAFVTRVVTGFQRMYAGAVAIFNAIRAWIVGVFTAIYGFVAPIVSAIVGFVVARWNTLVGNVARIMAGIRSVITTAWNFIAGIVSAVGARIMGAVRAAWAAVSGAISGAVARVRGIVSAGFNALVGLVSGPVNRVHTTVSSAFSRVVSAITGFIGRARTAAASVASSIYNAIRDGISNMASIGSDIVSGIINGITGMAGTLKNKVTSFINDNVPAPVRKLLGISSPSRLFITFGRYVVQGLVIGLLGNANSVRSAGLRVLNNLTDLFRGGKKEAAKNGVRITEAAQAALIRSVKSANARLATLAAQRDSVAKRLASAQGALATAQKTANDFKASLRASLVGSVNVSGARNAGDIVWTLQNQLAAVKKFQTDMATLAKRGLNKDYLAQIAAGGLDNAATASALASGSAAQLKQVNTLQGQLNTAATSTSGQIANSLYGAGIAAAQGLVAGLVSQQKAIEAQMLAIAKGMQTAIKKALGIKSPSRVMRTMGSFTGQGLALGIAGEQRNVAAASRSLAAASLTGYQSFKPGSVPNPTAAGANVRVFIGDRELTDIVRVETTAAQDDLGRQLTYGRRV